MRNHGQLPIKSRSIIEPRVRRTQHQYQMIRSRAVEAVEEHRNNYDGGGSSVVALRHEGMTEWKAKKKELRMQQKELAKTFGSGYTRKLGSGPVRLPLCFIQTQHSCRRVSHSQAGTTAREFLALEEDIERSGRTVRVPCSPPHCFMRCATDQPCVTHPLVSEWRPPGPRLCPRYDFHQGSNVLSRPLHEKWAIYQLFCIPEQDVVECASSRRMISRPLSRVRHDLHIANFIFGHIDNFYPLGRLQTDVSKSYIFGPADEAEQRLSQGSFRCHAKAGWDCMACKF